MPQVFKPVSRSATWGSSWRGHCCSHKILLEWARPVAVHCTPDQSLSRAVTDIDWPLTGVVWNSGLAFIALSFHVATWRETICVRCYRSRVFGQNPELLTGTLQLLVAGGLEFEWDDGRRRGWRWTGRWSVSIPFPRPFMAIFLWPAVCRALAGATIYSEDPHSDTLSSQSCRKLKIRFQVKKNDFEVRQWLVGPLLNDHIMSFVDDSISCLD